MGYDEIMRTVNEIREEIEVNASIISTCRLKKEFGRTLTELDHRICMDAFSRINALLWVLGEPNNATYLDIRDSLT